MTPGFRRDHAIPCAGAISLELGVVGCRQMSRGAACIRGRLVDADVPVLFSRDGGQIRPPRTSVRFRGGLPLHGRLGVLARSLVDEAMDLRPGAALMPTLTHMPMTDGDREFQRYLRDRGLVGADDHEPELGGPTYPDFLIRHDGGEVLFEVKSIEESPLQRKIDLFLPAGQPFTMGPDEVHKPIRSAIKEAARQLKPHRQEGRALVAVVANPRGVAVLLSDNVVIGAMYGDPTYVMPIDPTLGGAVGEGQMAFLRNGKLTRDHPYISGVLILGAGLDGVPVVSVYETVAAACNGTAERLPLHIFDGSHDRRHTWEPNGDHATIVHLGANQGSNV